MFNKWFHTVVKNKTDERVILKLGIANMRYKNNYQK